MLAIQQQLNKKVALLSVELPYEYMVLRYMFIVVALLVLVYLYLVSASVLNVIAQKESNQASAALESNLGELEGKYFSLMSTVTEKKAAELGLSPLAASSYVYRYSTVGVVSSDKNAI